MNITELALQVNALTNKLNRYKKYRSLARMYAYKLTTVEGRLMQALQDVQPKNEPVEFDYDIISHGADIYISSWKLAYEYIEGLSKKTKLPLYLGVGYNVSENHILYHKNSFWQQDNKPGYHVTINDVTGKLGFNIVIGSQPRPYADKLIFSNRVVASHLKIHSSEISGVYKDGENAIANLNGKEIKISKQDALVTLAALRKHSSNGLICTPHINNKTRFTVRNPYKDSTYQLQATKDNISCDCPDFTNLSNKLNSQKVACKHVYAVLNHLGHSSLRDYIASWKPEGETQKLKDYVANIAPENDYPKCDSYSLSHYESSYSYY